MAETGNIEGRFLEPSTKPRSERIPVRLLAASLYETLPKSWRVVALVDLPMDLKKKASAKKRRL
jgi:hypothetical protein